MQERTTKYTTAVSAFIAEQGHATNAAILAGLQKTYPEVSATTIHRITSRMIERHELAAAPSTLDNAARFDANLQPHDHFQCINCDGLRDVELPDSVISVLKNIMEDCQLTGQLTIQGTCAKCCKKE
jgi:Fur family peroxide stress response transcriptional regulator